MDADIPHLELPPDLVEAAQEINEPRTVEEKRAIIGEFLQKVESDVGDSPTAADALKYLRLRKWRMDAALETYHRRCAFLREHGSLLQGLQLQDFQDLYADSFVRVLSGLDLHRRRMLCMRIRNPRRWDPLDATFLRWMVYGLDALSEDVYFQVNGVIVLNNLGEVKLVDAMYMAGLLRSGRMQKVFTWIQDCSPARVAGIIMLRPPRFVHIVWNLMRLFLRPKLRQRVRFARSTAALHDMVDPSVLPPLWGGTSDEDPWAWYTARLAQAAPPAGGDTQQA